MEATPWNELIDMPVFEDSIANLGELVGAAELLWEITFLGFSAKAAENTLKQWEKAEYSAATYDDTDDNENQNIRWDVSRYYEFDEGEDEEDVTLDELLDKLKSEVCNSKYEYFVSDIESVLYSMLRGLDFDVQYTLLNAIVYPE